MLQASQIVTPVVRGFVHVARLGMYRKWKVPYRALGATRQIRFDLEASWPQPSPVDDASLGDTPFIPLREIATSIQY